MIRYNCGKQRKSTIAIGVIDINTKEIKKQRILDILIKSKKVLTVNDIALKIGSSEKTVRNYLKELKEESIEKGYTIVVKPKTGIEIRFESINEISEVQSKIDKSDNGSFQRYIYILKILLENRFTYTTQLFADELYCSKTTVNNDLKLVEDWLVSKNVNLVKRPNQGVYIEGNEEDIRKALIELYKMIESSKGDEEEEIIKKLDCRLDCKTYYKLKELFTTLDLIEIQNIVKEAEECLGYCFTKEGFINIIMHIAVAICRLKDKKGITIPMDTFNTVKDTKEFDIASNVVKNLATIFKVEIPIDEIAYIALHMLGTKIQINNLMDSDDDDNNYYMDIAKRITQLIGEVLEEDIEMDNVLIRGLALHLRPTIIRLKNGITIENPLLEEIKKQLANIFSATWACSSIFQEEIGVMINEDEVAYLTLHIASSVERIKKKTKVLVVCSSGIGTSQFLATRIESKFDGIEVVGIIPYSYLNKELVNKCDLVISTMGEGINTFDKDIINVSALLHEEDIAKIKNKISTLRKKKVHIRSCVGEMENIIDKNLLFDCKEDLTFEEIISKYGQILIDQEFANEGFVENVIAREKISSTNIGRGIAIPHSEEHFVKESKVCIIRLNNPIKLGSTRVDLLFILCLKFGDIKVTKKFFKGFYQVINDDEIVKQIREVKNKNEIKSLFINGGN